MTKPSWTTGLAEVLSGATQVYVGVSTQWGPHVTPELFAISDQRIVCMTAAGTIKSRRLRRAPQVAIAARDGARSISVVGTATVIDPASPATLMRAPRRSATASLDAVRYTVGNLAELSGAAVDLLAGRLGGAIPPHRVVIIIEPRAAAVVEGGAVREHFGWNALRPVDHRLLVPPGNDSDQGRGTGSRVPDLGVLPDGLAPLVDATDTVVGWTRDDGTPLTFPAFWDHLAAVATVPSDLFRLAGAAQHSAACVAFDTWSGYGPSGKQGLMLRGDGVASDHGGSTELRCTLRRATYWDGTATASAVL